MFLRTEISKTQYTRKSKFGKLHQYFRNKTVVYLRCDCCNCEFVRELRRMDRKRLSNNYFHVCEKCDSKRFAQRKGIEQKKIWNMPASVTLPVGKY